MKTKVVIVAAVVVIALTGGTAWANQSSVSPQGSGFEATYTANISYTLNGNNVTNVMIFEEGSGQVRVNFPYTLPVGGVSVLSDTLAFSPTSALIVGLDLTTPLDATGKRHVVMFVNDAFPSIASGRLFSDVFDPLHEQAFIADLLSVQAGDPSKLDSLKLDFTNGPLTQAAFAPGGSFAVVESSTFPTVPEPSTMLLIGSGLLGLVGLRKKFKK